jgi:hypothetical protein
MRKCFGGSEADENNHKISENVKRKKAMQQKMFRGKSEGNKSWRGHVMMRDAHIG